MQKKKELSCYKSAKIASKSVFSVLCMADEAGGAITSVSVTIGLSDKKSRSQGNVGFSARHPIQ
jgi:hypothetical protein